MAATCPALLLCNEYLTTFEYRRGVAPPCIGDGGGGLVGADFQNDLIKRSPISAYFQHKLSLPNFLVNPLINSARETNNGIFLD